jgi:hypothetical protein
VSTIVTLLIDLAVRLGRFILERLARHGYKRLLSYMRRRIKVFRGRLERARTVHREVWLRGRIERWTNAIKWLEQNAAKVAAEAVHTICELDEVKRLPLHAACEKYKPA